MRRLVFALIVFLIASAVAAQENPPGLSAADAALLASANAAPLNSFAFQFNASLTIQLDTFNWNGVFSGSGTVDRQIPAVSASVSGNLGFVPDAPINAELRWVNDTLYLNLGDGWQVLEGVSTKVSDIISDATGLSVDADRLSKGNLLGIDGLPAMLASLAQVNPASFQTAHRLADETVDNTPTAHFRVNADLRALMQTDAFVDAIAALANAQGSNLIIYDHAQLAQMLRANLASIDDAVLGFDEYIGLDDKQFHRIVVGLDMQFTPTNAGYVDAPFVVEGMFDITLSKHNLPQTISAPANAKPLVEVAFPAEVAPSHDYVGVQYQSFGSVGDNATATQSFVGYPDTKVTITVRRFSLDFDPMVTLLSPSGAVLAQNNDHEAAVFALSDYDSQIVDFAIPADGIYKVGVSGSDGSGGSFILTIDEHG